MRRIVLSATVVALVATMMVVSSLSVTAQQYGQYGQDTGQYAQDTGTTAGTSVICAPWSKAWDVSKGQWYYEWYRWCVDTSLYDPTAESSWYMERGSKEWGEQVNLCPETGKCTMSPGGVQMSTTTTTP